MVQCPSPNDRQNRSKITQMAEAEDTQVANASDPDIAVLDLLSTATIGLWMRMFVV